MIWPFSAQLCSEFLTFICCRSMKHYDTSRLPLFGCLGKKKTYGMLTGVRPTNRLVWRTFWLPTFSVPVPAELMCCCPPARIVQSRSWRSPAWRGCHNAQLDPAESWLGCHIFFCPAEIKRKRSAEASRRRELCLKVNVSNKHTNIQN